MIQNLTCSNRLAHSCEEHEAMMAALLSGDAPLASERFRMHLNVVQTVSTD
jgi:DNA-binding GntR family transcriptional regulator